MSLRSNIIRAIKKRLIDVANLNNKITDIFDIQKEISNVLIEKNLAKPLLLPDKIIRLDKDSKNTMNKHNNNVSSIHNDSVVIRDTINELWNKVEYIDIIQNNSNIVINNIDRLITKRIKEIRRNYMLGVSTIIDNFSDIRNIDKLKGTTINTEANTVTLKVPDISDNIVTMADADVSVYIDKNIPLSVPHNIKQLLFPGNDTIIQMKAMTDNREHIEISITVTFPERQLTNIGINIVNNTLVKMSIYGNDNILVKDESIVKGYYTYNIPQKKYSRIKFTFKMDMESYIENEKHVYTLSILKLILSNIDFNTYGEVISKELSFNKPITDISLKATDWTPLGTSIDYYISKDNGKTWMKIEPIHSIYEKPIWYPISNSSEISFITEIKKPLKYDNNITGNVELYNIFDNEENNDYIENNAIKVPQDWEIDTNKTTIHYGINDYQIINDYIEMEKIGNITEYIFDKDDNSWHDMHIQIKNEPHNVMTAKFTLNYTPIDSDDILITDGSKIYTNYTLSGKEVTITEAINDGTQIYVDYKTYLTTIEETDNMNIIIDKESVKVTDNPTSDSTLDVTNIFDIRYDEKKIRLLPNADIALDKSESKYVLYILFNYTMKTKVKYRQYKTYVHFNQNTTIGILPFTDDEISAGNIHLIDGINVSKYKEFKISNGWHTIVTTQPFPSNTDPGANDVNDITGKISKAGIILKDYDEMVAYKNDMNYVKLNKLANIIIPSDNRSFSIYNNKIYINFQPDYPVNENTTGNKLLCRKVIWDNRVVAEYKTNYPKFKVNIKLKPTSESTDAVQSFRYKIVIQRNSGKTSPVIHKLEWMGL